MNRVTALAMFGLAAPLMGQAPADSVVLRRVDSLATVALTQGPLAGLSIAVARGDRIVLAKGYGYADLEHRTPATPATMYQIGSITKQFTAVAIMQLAEQGKVRLDADFSTYLPDSPVKGRRLTVAQLLDHTSGLKNYTALGPVYMQDTFRLDLPTERMARLIAAQPLDFEPGTDWDYTNSGFFLAGMVVEKVSGMSYAEYVRQEIAERAGLAATEYCDMQAVRPGRAKGYQAARGGGLENAPPISMTVPYAAGALCSTALDLVKYQRALVSGTLIRPASYQRMTRPAVLKDGWRTIYGLGLVNDVFAGQRMIGHGGQINGFWSVLFYYPAQDVTVVLLSNVNPAGGKSLWTIGFELGAIATGASAPRLADVAVPAAVASRIAGKYVTPAMPFELQVRDGKAYLAGIGPEALPLKRQQDGSFRAEWDPFLELRIEAAPPAGGGCRLKGGGFAPLTWKCRKV
jgi:CubicO group peptidase (beta-lactamase class C family)